MSMSLALTSARTVPPLLCPVGCYPEKSECCLSTSLAQGPTQSLCGAAKQLLHLDPEALVPHWAASAIRAGSLAELGEE